MKQKSKEWFAARKHKLTGSNAGAALGLNPYKTPDDLVRQMVREYHGAEPEFTGNVATEHGTQHEPLAVMDYFAKTGNFAEECGFFVHPEHDWLGASPDALLEENGVLEVKCPFGLRNKKGDELVFKSADEQPHYHAQMQVEMACTGRTVTHFYQWAKHGDSLEVVPFSEAWWAEHLPQMQAFYDYYLSELDNPAHLEPKEKEINSLKALDMLNEYDELKAKIDDAEARRKELLAKLVALAGEHNAVIHGRKLSKVERKGNVDYKKVPELLNVDLEPYRKKASEYWKLT